MATVLQHPFGTTTFGDFLRSARERRGLTIQQIANETKIPRRLLESLEHGDFGAIPAGMYQRAEIRAYAKAVGLDPALALGELERALGTSAVSSEGQVLLEDRTEGLRHRPFLAAAFAIAIALIGMVAWYGRMTPLPTEERRAIAVASAEAGGAKAGGAKAPPPQQTAQQTNTLPQTGTATAPPPQAAPVAGLITELVVVTDPPGARVIVDGIGRGTTPVTIRYLAAGEKRVRVLKDGFSADERTVRLAPAREPTTVVIPLRGPAQ